jgi:CRISPR-associated protein (TIGR03986 family)
MSLPKHKNPVDNNGDLISARTASAPYNFVPLPEVVVKAVTEAERLPDHNTYANAGYPNTGYFDVTLTTKSPLYVRCPFTIDEFQRQESEQRREAEARLPHSQQVKNTPHFFYTRNQDQPIIPGSSLRGMLRSLVEIISYSKVRWVTDKKLFYRTVDRTSVGGNYTSRMSLGNGHSGNGFRQKAEAGFIRKRGAEWIIEKCEVARVEMHAVASAFGVAGPTPLASKSNLYTGLNPNGYPKWAYQHQTVWVQTEPSERDHPHSQGRFLRYLKVTDIRTSASGAPGEREGILVLTGPMQRQHMAFVFVPIPSAATIDVPNDPDENDPNKQILDRFHDDDQISRWQSSVFQNGQPPGTRRAHKGFVRDGEPVFFLRESGQLTFFGRAQMFRLPYSQAPLDLVPKKLRRPEEIDYADAMFGFVRTRQEIDDIKARGLQEPPQGSKARAYASRVFVTDAALTERQTDIWFSGDPVMTPRIMATPKPTTFQHYLVQTNDDRNTLKHYGSPTPQETVIRGHKRYWHQGLTEGHGLTLDQIRQRIEEDRDKLREIARQEANGKADTQHTRFKPVKPEVSFTFRVYFENLSDRELGALCWTLHPLGDTEKAYCHHLGMGKPLGMGAVRLEATQHLTNRQTRYTTLFADDHWQTGSTGAGESLTDRATLEQRTNEFERHILGELQLDGQCRHLSDLKRIGMLLKTMEWPGYRAEAARPGQPSPNNCVVTDNANGQRRPNTRYMTIELLGVQGAQKNEYRERPVLPDPEAFGSLTGQAEPTVRFSLDGSPQASGGRGGEPTSQPSQPAQPNRASADMGEVESVKRALSSLRGPGEVSLLDGIVSRIEHLPNSADQRECAQLLHSWLKANKLWRKEKHSQKDWHKKLETLLESPTHP